MQPPHDGIAGNGQDAGNPLFGGMKFWLSHAVPQRTRFIAEITRYGGNVVNLEKDADVKLYDHTRKSVPPNTYSYQFVEKSIRNNRLENLEDHRAGPHAGHARPIGDVTVTTRGGRTAFTAADDQFLWDWVKPIEEAGGSVKGNEIYKHIEAENPRHSYQSWRDRWIKHVSQHKIQYSKPREPRAFRNRLAHREDTPPPPPPPLTDRSDIGSTDKFKSFTSNEYEMIFRAAKHIVNMQPGEAPKAWNNFAREYTKHAATEWQAYWEEVVRPDYEKQKAKETKTQHRQESGKASADNTDDAATQSYIDLTGSRSPSFQPESPSLQSSINRSSQSQPPISNEARKRSPVRGPSNSDGPSSSPRAKRKRGDIDDEHTITASDRVSRKKSAVEIPPSPPSDLEGHRNKLQQISHSDEEVEEPNQTKIDRPFSPLLVPEEVGPETPRTKRTAQEANSPQTSPMDIRLLLDENPNSTFENDVLGPSAQIPRSASEELRGDSEEAETATSEDNFETAQTENTNDSEPFETAQQGRLETQAILEQTQGDLDFGLAEPEGGWAAYEEELADDHPDLPGTESSTQKTPKPLHRVPQSYQITPSDLGDFPSSPLRTVNSKKAQGSSLPSVAIGKQEQSATARSPRFNNTKALQLSPAKSFTANSALPACSDLDTYLESRLAYFGPSFSGPRKQDLQPLLLRSVRRTLTSLAAATPNAFNLADRVFDCLSHGQPVPEDVPGIWTEKDDTDVMGSDARGVERVSRKHGDEGMRGRWEVLDVIGMGAGPKR